MTSTPKICASKAIIILLSILVGVGASAQGSSGADTASTEAGEVEEIVVTGSRLKRDSFNVSTPLVQVDQDALIDTGLGSTAEILVDEVPSLYESQSNMNSQSSVAQTRFVDCQPAATRQ